MVKHQQGDQEWWCLPGGGIEPGESPSEAALRELQEECCVHGNIIRETSVLRYGLNDEHYTYYVDIGAQEPRLGYDPESGTKTHHLVDLAWMELREPRFWDETSTLPARYGLPLYPATPEGATRALFCVRDCPVDCQLGEMCYNSAQGWLFSGL